LRRRCSATHADVFTALRRVLSRGNQLLAPRNDATATDFERVQDGESPRSSCPPRAIRSADPFHRIAAALSRPPAEIDRFVMGETRIACENQTAAMAAQAASATNGKAGFRHGWVEIGVPPRHYSDTRI